MLRRTSISALGLLAALAACGDEPEPNTAAKRSKPLTPPTTSATSALALPPAPLSVDGRLPSLAVPLRYELSLNLDPEAPSFSGRVRITIRPTAPTRYLVLHGEHIEVKRATWVTATTRTNVAVTARATNPKHDSDELVFTLEEPARSEGILDVAFDAKFDGELSGAYKAEDGGKKYVFTQFEATSARKAFPCFDEPAFKTPWDVEIRVPSERKVIALANMPQKSAPTTDGDQSVYKFETSPPMPSYLVAFAVGDFGFRETAGSKPPIRIVTPAGKEALGDVALEATAALNKKLEGYFGILYPYPKLDVVAVPDFGAGAMENPGLVTFREERLLLDKKQSTLSSRRGQAETIAHELAHQWFGDLVTAAWWNEIWLNEGMATWMEAVVTDAWQPSFGARLEQIQSIGETMATDSLATARAVRQPVKSTDEANEAFDGLTYEKGGAILSMLESYVGADVFQRGVQKYLKDHAWGVATSDDLFAALESVAPNKQVKVIAASFLNKPGVPVIHAERKCAALTQHSIVLTTKAYRRLGSKAPTNLDWSVPVTVRLAGGITVAWGIPLPGMTGMTIPVPDNSADNPAGSAFYSGGVAGRGARVCPAWMWPNREQQGYYFVDMSEPDWRALFTHVRELSVAERMGALQSLWAQAKAGGARLGMVLELLRVFDNDDNRYTSELVAGIIRDVGEIDLGPAFGKSFQQYARERLAAKRRRLGAVPKGEDQTLLARELDDVLVEVAHDAETIKRIGDTANKWLAARDSVPVEQAYHALVLASRDAPADRFDVLVKRLGEAKDAEERTTIVLALASFRDAARVQRMLELAMTETLRLQDARYVFRPMLRHAESQKIAAEWVLSHWDPIRARFKGGMASMFVGVTSTARDEATLARYVAFFEPKIAELKGSARRFAEAREEAELEIALRAHLQQQGPSLK